MSITSIVLILQCYQSSPFAIMMGRYILHPRLTPGLLCLCHFGWWICFADSAPLGSHRGRPTSFFLTWFVGQLALALLAMHMVGVDHNLMDCACGVEGIFTLVTRPIISCLLGIRRGRNSPHVARFRHCLLFRVACKQRDGQVICTIASSVW
jgi:hypothetical protein